MTYGSIQGQRWLWGKVDAALSTSPLRNRFILCSLALLFSPSLPSSLAKGKRMKQKHRLIDTRSHTVLNSSGKKPPPSVPAPCPVSHVKVVESLLSLPSTLSDSTAHRTTPHFPVGLSSVQSHLAGINGCKSFN